MFNLPSEAEAFRAAQKGGEYLGILQEFDNWLKGQIKHNNKKYQEVRDTLYELAGDIWEF